MHEKRDEIRLFTDFEEKKILTFNFEHKKWLTTLCIYIYWPIPLRCFLRLRLDGARSLSQSVISNSNRLRPDGVRGSVYVESAILDVNDQRAPKLKQRKAYKGNDFGSRKTA